MIARREDEFRFNLLFDGDRPVVAVGGEVTPLTAPTITAVVLGLADSGHRHLVLDLAEVDFMDGSGLKIIVDISRHLVRTHGSLAIQNAPEQVRRVLAVAGPVANISFEPASTPADDGLGDPPRDADELVGGHTRALSGDLVRVGAHPTTEIVDVALRSLTHLAGASLGGADGASVTLERNGRLATVAATNGTIVRMDAHQYETGEGPCLAAGAHGRAFYADSLTQEHRWPSFVPLALEEGIGSILSTPVTVGTQTIGALNVYAKLERVFGAHERALADVFAGEASAIIAAGASAVDGRLADKISRALQSREVIALARGVLMARSHISVDEASAALIRCARVAEVTVLQHATEIVAAAATAPDDPPDREPRHRG